MLSFPYTVMTPFYEAAVKDELLKALSSDCGHYELTSCLTIVEEFMKVSFNSNEDLEYVAYKIVDEDSHYKFNAETATFTFVDGVDPAENFLMNES